MTMWYEAAETPEERQSRTDRYGNEIHGPPTAFSRIVDRAYGIVRPMMRRPPRGVAVPFGLEHRDSLRWRVSPDIRRVLIAEWPQLEPYAVATIPAETLFGVRIEVDPTAPDGTLKLANR